MASTTRKLKVIDGRKIKRPSNGLRAKKKLETRQRLEQTALKLFLKYGYDEVTVSEICVAAEVAETTFFRHFRSKEEVLYADTENVLQRYREVTSSCPPDMPLIDVAIFSMERLFEDMLDRDAQVIRARLVMSDHPTVKAFVLGYEARVIRELTKILAERLNDSEKDGPTAHMLANVIVAAARWVRLRPDESGELPSAKSVADRIMPTVKSLKFLFSE